MLKCNCEIIVKAANNSRVISFDFVNKIEINSSYEDLTDTCNITIPRSIQFEGKNLFVGNDAIFKRGDRIEVKIGYEPNLESVFNGFIRNIGSGLPTVLECEDEMYRLKQFNVTFPKGGGKAQTTKLSGLLDAIIPTIPYKIIDDIDLGAFRVTRATPAMVLDKLKSEYGLFSYFRDGFLYIGFANNATDTLEAEFKMEEVIINSDTLEWQEEDEVKVKVVAISMDFSNTKIQAEAGDVDGDQKTIHKFKMTKSELKKVAEAYVKEFKYTGFKGEVETFGEPIMRHGDRARITSTKLPERDGTYLIKRVKRVYGVNEGNHQIFTLGVKIA
jgi:translation initiation factor 2 beta subunit (eIF-2beta)/eIF-5